MKRPLTQRGIKKHKYYPTIPVFYMKTKKNLSGTLSQQQSLKLCDKHPSVRGVGIIVPSSSSKQMFTVKFITLGQLKNFITSPSKVKENLVQIHRNGSITPFNLPHFAYLALFPKAIKHFYWWLLNNSTASDMMTNIDLVFRETSLRMPFVREEYKLELGNHETVIRNYSNVLTIIRVDPNNSNRIRIHASSGQTTIHELDGTSWTVNVNASKGKTIDRRRVTGLVERDYSFVVWSCRGMGRSVFSSLFENIVESHDPEMVLIVETRLQKFMTNAILQYYPCISTTICPPTGLVGGAVLFHRSKNIDVVVQKVMENDMQVNLTLASV